MPRSFITCLFFAGLMSITLTSQMTSPSKEESESKVKRWWFNFNHNKNNNNNNNNNKNNKNNNNINNNNGWLNVIDGSFLRFACPGGSYIIGYQSSVTLRSRGSCIRTRSWEVIVKDKLGIQQNKSWLGRFEQNIVVSCFCQTIAAREIIHSTTCFRSSFSFKRRSGQPTKYK